jgi:hypothetical protein
MGGMRTRASRRKRTSRIKRAVNVDAASGCSHCQYCEGLTVTNLYGFLGVPRHVQEQSLPTKLFGPSIKDVIVVVLLQQCSILNRPIKSQRY